jgi:hypothetical protein
VEEELAEDFERLDFDVDRSPLHPQLPPALVELAVAEPPDVAGGEPARIACGEGDPRVYPSLEFLESSVRTAERRAA